MYVRFRKRKCAARSAGLTSHRFRRKVSQKHLGSLGSIAGPASARDSCDFWQRFHERFGRLETRIDDAEFSNLIAVIQKRIPMVTSDQQLKLSIQAERTIIQDL